MKRILDVCCGSKMMYFDKERCDVAFGDIRHKIITVPDRSHGNPEGERVIKIEPDIIFDFRKLPYRDREFSLVIFDPPHLVRSGDNSWLASKYGRLGKSWKTDLEKGFSECFRVLAENGTLVFKWNEYQIPVYEILKLAKAQPVCGNRSGKHARTHWFVFFKMQGFCPKGGEETSSASNST